MQKCLFGVLHRSFEFSNGPELDINDANLFSGLKKVANLLKAIDTNKELDGVAPTRIGMMLKALKFQSPGLKLHLVQLSYYYLC